MRFYAVKGGTVLNFGGTLTIEVRHPHYVAINLRPGSKDPVAVMEDIERRASQGLHFDVSDQSGDWFFKYRHRVNGKNEKPDPDGTFLREYERQRGID